MLELFARDHQKIDQAASYGRRISSMQRVFRAIQQQAIFKANTVTANVSLTQPAVDNAVRALVELGIVGEITGRRRNRIYRYTALMDLLNEGTELPA